MKKNSIKRLFGIAAAEAAPEDSGEAKDFGDTGSPGRAESEPRVSAAERLGKALLESLGGVEGVSEDELVDAVLESRAAGMEAVPRRAKDTADPAEGIAEALREDAADAPSDQMTGARVWEDAPVPVPMRTGSGRTEPVDYSTMSAEQFARLRKLLKKANADGKRIKL